MNKGLAVALVCALGLTACGGDPAAPTSSGDSGKSPLAEYMGSDFVGGMGQMSVSVSSIGGGSSEEDLAKQRKVEEATAACMRDQGFRYVPVTSDGGAKPKFVDAFKLPPDKFAEQYGYGISTLDIGQPDENSDDPNTKIRNGLSAKAKAAYDKALGGGAGTGSVVIAGGSDGKVDELPQGPEGCRGKALKQVYGEPQKGDPGKEMRRFDGLFKDLDALRKRIDADQRVVDAAKAWSDCMADARYPDLAKPDDARQRVSERMARLLGIQPGGPGSGTGKPIKPKQADPAQLAALKKYELAIAKADYTCQQQGYQKSYDEVRFQLEREFVDSHKAVLEQYKEWAAQNKGPR
jgi:hypothetical protein